MVCDACPANSKSPAGSVIATGCTRNAGFSGTNSGSGCSESSSPDVIPTPLTPTAGPTYSRLSAGTCTAYGFQNIDSSSECSTAATALGLADTTVKGIPTAARPKGCTESMLRTTGSRSIRMIRVQTAARLMDICMIASARLCQMAAALNLPAWL